MSKPSTKRKLKKRKLWEDYRRRRNIARNKKKPRLPARLPASKKYPRKKKAVVKVDTPRPSEIQPLKLTENIKLKISNLWKKIKNQ